MVKALDSKSDTQMMSKQASKQASKQGINYTVAKIPCKTAKEYIIKHHYAHGCHNAPSPCYGLFDADKLIGVLMFATPCSENVRASVFGESMKNSVVELHRLHVLDITPKNTESYFISRCLKLLKKDRPQTKAVISFSDTTIGHNGIIYQASNFWFIGKTSPATFYVDESGRLRHPRQNGNNITSKEAKQRGWKPTKRSAKNRYLYILSSSKRERKQLIKMCKYDLLNSKWCFGCGKEMPINSYYSVCDACLDKSS